MIQMQTLLEVADNSGAKLVQCIKVLGGSKHMIATVGDVIVVSVKSSIPKSKAKKGEVLFGVIVRIRKEVTRNDGTSIKFDDNAVVLLNKQLEMIGSRVFGPVCRELKGKNFSKILSLASEVL